MKVVYVAGPYSSPDEYQRSVNIFESWAIARQLWTIPEVAAISPNANTAQMGGTDIAYEKFLAGDFEMIRRVDALVMSPRWRESKGAVREHAFGLSLGKKIFYWCNSPKSIRAVMDEISEWAK